MGTMFLKKWNYVIMESLNKEMEMSIMNVNDYLLQYDCCFDDNGASWRIFYFDQCVDIIFLLWLLYISSSMKIKREREREIFINNKLLAIPKVQQLKWSKWHLKLKSYESKLKVWKNRQRNEIFVTGFISLTSLFTFIEKIRILSSPRVLWGSGCKRYHNMTVYLNPVNPSLS